MAWRTILLAIIVTMVGYTAQPVRAATPTPTATWTPTATPTPTATSTPISNLPQNPSPKSMLVAGSVYINARPAQNVTIRAFIGDRECGATSSVRTVDTYVDNWILEVVSATDLPGCGAPGAIVRFKVGSDFANETVAWQAGFGPPLTLVVGPEFARYGGAFTYTTLPGAAHVEAVIGGVVCGQQLNPMQGEGPSYGYDIIVDSAQTTPGCGMPGAAVEFRLVTGEAGNTKPIATAIGTATWQPGLSAKQSLAFTRSPLSVLPAAGSGTRSREALHVWLQFALMSLGCGTLLAAASKVRRRS